MTSLEDRVRWVKREDKNQNPIDFFREHHAGLTRGELAKQDPSLYKRLRRDGLLEHVPTKSSKRR